MKPLVRKIRLEAALTLSAPPLSRTCPGASAQVGLVCSQETASLQVPCGGSAGFSSSSSTENGCTIPYLLLLSRLLLSACGSQCLASLSRSPLSGRCCPPMALQSQPRQASRPRGLSPEVLCQHTWCQTSDGVCLHVVYRLQMGDRIQHQPSPPWERSAACRR